MTGLDDLGNLLTALLLKHPEFIPLYLIGLWYIVIRPIVAARRVPARPVEVPPVRGDNRLRKCPNCGAGYRLSDYSAAAAKVYCSGCSAELPEPN